MRFFIWGLRILWSKILSEEEFQCGTAGILLLSWREVIFLEASMNLNAEIIGQIKETGTPYNVVAEFFDYNDKFTLKVFSYDSNILFER